MSERIGVIGAGAWGTALAKVLAECGHEVTLWCLESELAKGIAETGENALYLPGVALPPGLRPETDPLTAASGKDVLFLAVPSPYLMGIVRRILSAPNLMEGESLVVVVTKGFIADPRLPRLILDTLEDRLPGAYRDRTVYLSGPSHAEEVSRGRITGLAAASRNGRNAIRVRELFRGSRVLVFPSLDTTGVQVCAAAKRGGHRLRHAGRPGRRGGPGPLRVRRQHRVPPPRRRSQRNAVWARPSARPTPRPSPPSRASETSTSPAARSTGATGASAAR